MSEYEMMQWAAVGGGALVVTAGIAGFVRFSRRLAAVFPDAAKKYGLTHQRVKQGNALGNQAYGDVLQGAVEGVLLEVSALTSHVGNTRRSGTSARTQGANAWPRPFQVQVSRLRPAAAFHLVTTGDARFDATRFLTSDAADDVRALMTPRLRAALAKCPQSTLHLAVQGAACTLSVPSTPGSAAELEGLVDAALAAAASTPSP